MRFLVGVADHAGLFVLQRFARDGRVGDFGADLADVGQTH